MNVIITNGVEEMIFP